MVRAYLVGIDERPVLVFEWRDVFEVCRLVVLGVAVDVIDFVAVWSRAYPCGCYEFVLRLVEYAVDEVAVPVVLEGDWMHGVADGEGVRVVPFRGIYFAVVPGVVVPGVFVLVFDGEGLNCRPVVECGCFLVEVFVEGDGVDVWVVGVGLVV